MEHVSAVVNQSGTVNPPLGDLSSPCNNGHSRERKTFPDRAQCFLLVNLPEASVAELQGTLDYDLSPLRHYLSRILTSEKEAAVNSVRVTAAFCLGKQQTSGEQPRPHKVVLSTVDEARLVLHRAYKLKGESVRILRDLSPEQRQQLKLATVKLNERRLKGETDLVIQDLLVRN
ncbi:hypothetical protein FGIG_07846 [Fasciola gigantica]|uniref:Uncharacterized protein n=1 Tax=Fasciola gigantica TaxID=46835 RepID=A0A504Z6D9_FASGI|nr:hypothetical protein FGIG_07846 [Fasciola gigantica]